MRTAEGAITARTTNGVTIAGNFMILTNHTRGHYCQVHKTLFGNWTIGTSRRIAQVNARHKTVMIESPTDRNATQRVHRRCLVLVYSLRSCQQAQIDVIMVQTCKPGAP